jgi:hypothetical protein
LPASGRHESGHSRYCSTYFGDLNIDDFALQSYLLTKAKE